MNVSDYRRLFDYESWANRAMLAALPEEEPRAIALFSHILASQRLWLDRLTSAPQSMSVWPSLTIAACRSLLSALEEDWSTYLVALDDSELSTSFTYVNTKGETWTNTIEDTLTHLVTHSCYHRGQIAQTLRLADRNPPYTDFIQAARQRLV